MPANDFNPDSYSEYPNKPLSPLEQLRRMEQDLINKHQKTQVKKSHNSGFRTAPEKPKPKHKGKKGQQAGVFKYGMPAVYKLKGCLTARAVRFLKLMGGYQHFIETLAQTYEFKNPDLFKDLPDPPVEKKPNCNQK